MKEPLFALIFYVAILLLVSLAAYKLVVWVVSGIAVGMSG